MDILRRLTNVGYNTIKNWHKEWQKNPEFYKKDYRPPNTEYLRKNFVKNIIGEGDKLHE
jgi:hypothetical protein